MNGGGGGTGSNERKPQIYTSSRGTTFEIERNKWTFSNQFEKLPKTFREVINDAHEWFFAPTDVVPFAFSTDSTYYYGVPFCHFLRVGFQATGEVPTNRSHLDLAQLFPKKNYDFSSDRLSGLSDRWRKRFVDLDITQAGPFLHQEKSNRAKYPYDFFRARAIPTYVYAVSRKNKPVIVGEDPSKLIVEVTLGDVFANQRARLRHSDEKLQQAQAEISYADTVREGLLDRLNSAESDARSALEKYDSLLERFRGIPNLFA